MHRLTQPGRPLRHLVPFIFFFSTVASIVILCFTPILCDSVGCRAAFTAAQSFAATVFALSAASFLLVTCGEKMGARSRYITEYLVPTVSIVASLLLAYGAVRWHLPEYHLTARVLLRLAFLAMDACELHRRWVFDISPSTPGFFTRANNPFHFFIAVSLGFAILQAVCAESIATEDLAGGVTVRFDASGLPSQGFVPSAAFLAAYCTCSRSFSPAAPNTSDATFAPLPPAAPTPAATPCPASSPPPPPAGHPSPPSEPPPIPPRPQSPVSSPPRPHLPPPPAQRPTFTSSLPPCPTLRKPPSKPPTAASAARPPLQAVPETHSATRLLWPAPPTLAAEPTPSAPPPSADVAADTSPAPPRPRLYKTPEWQLRCAACRAHRTPPTPPAPLPPLPPPSQPLLHAPSVRPPPMPVPAPPPAAFSSAVAPTPGALPPDAPASPLAAVPAPSSAPPAVPPSVPPAVPPRDVPASASPPPADPPPTATPPDVQPPDVPASVPPPSASPPPTAALHGGHAPFRAPAWMHSMAPYEGWVDAVWNRLYYYGGTRGFWFGHVPLVPPAIVGAAG